MNRLAILNKLNKLSSGSSGGSWTPQYYVSNAGNDANTGLSPAQAWQTIAKVNATVKTGDKILFNKGDLWIEQLITNLLNSITIDAYGIGINPIIDGSDVKTGWTNDSGAIYYTTQTTMAMYFSNGARLINKASKVTMSAGSQFWDSGSNRMYVWLADGSDPSVAIMQVTSRESGILIGNSLNVDIKNISCRRQRLTGIMIDSGATSAQSVTIDSCSLTYIGSLGMGQNGGIGIKGNNAGDKTQNVAIKNCIVNNCMNNTLELSFVDTVLIEKNTLSDSGQGIELWRSVSNYTIRKNHIYNIYNIVGGSGQSGHNNAIWITDTTSSSGTGGHGNGIIYYNVFDTSYQELVDIGCGNVTMYNNTFKDGYYNRWGTTAFKAHALGTGATSVVFKNNIVYSTQTNNDYAYQVADGATLVSDYNLYYRYNMTVWKYNAADCAYLPNWITASGQDVHSLDGNQYESITPGFVSTSDFHLQSNSPCINAGTNVGLTEDYEGNPIVGLPDIGAYEKQ